MPHHPAPAVRSAALAEVCRTLAPGGSLHVVDFGGQVSAHDGLPARLAMHSTKLQDSLGDAVPEQRDHQQPSGCLRPLVERSTVERSTRLLGRTFIYGSWPICAGSRPAWRGEPAGRTEILSCRLSMWPSAVRRGAGWEMPT